MASFVLSFFPLDVLDEIWDLIESVSEGFLTYSCFFLHLFRSVRIFSHFLVSDGSFRTSYPPSKKVFMWNEHRLLIRLW